MFIRNKKTPNSLKTAVQLVQTVRTGKKVSQRIIRHFGYAHNDDEITALRKLALKYKVDLEEERLPKLFPKDTQFEILEAGMRQQEDNKPLLVNLKDLKEEKRLKMGVHQIIGSLFDEIRYHKILKNPSRKASAVRLMKQIVAARTEKPMSKRASASFIENEYGEYVSLNSVYRMMDYLDDLAIDKIKLNTYQYSKGLLGEKVDVIFYDCTTLYFESFIEDELKTNGYSKDGKFNQSQVVLAMMVTTAGLPIGYELFEGSKFEGHTLDTALDTLHKKYAIDKLIFVADSALLSTENIARFIEKKQAFIVGARIKNMPKNITQNILNKALYQPLYKELEKQAEQELSYQELTIKEEKLRLIVTHSTTRAKKDAHDRNNAIESLKKRLSKSKNPGSLLNNFGYKKFVQVQGQATLILNEEKIKDSQAWDGLHGIITNIEEDTAQSILSYYRGLWQIEETFRISKHDLRMRPVFHWTPERIKSHIALCFMALNCLRVLEYKVRLQYKKLSPRAIIAELSGLQTSILKDYKTQKKYCLPSKATQNAKKIYQIFGKPWRDTPYEIK